MREASDALSVVLPAVTSILPITIGCTGGLSRHRFAASYLPKDGRALMRELLDNIAKLEALAKKRIAAAQCADRCICSCHDDPSIIHVGPLCCERAQENTDVYPAVSSAAEHDRTQF